MKVVIVCTNYNTYESLDKYLDSLEIAFIKCKNIELTVVISDNSNTISEFNKNHSFNILYNITYKNLGYFGGIIDAISKTKIELKRYDYIVFSNVDLQVREDFFTKLELLYFDKNIGCIAPTIFSLNEKRNRNPKLLKRPSKRKIYLQRIFYKYPFFDFLYLKFFYKRRKVKNIAKSGDIIYASHGSFMLFTSSFADFLQSMKYDVFLFGEELFIAESLANNNLTTIYEPSLMIYDEDHVNTSKMKSKFYYKCNFDAINMIIREFY